MVQPTGLLPLACLQLYGDHVPDGDNDQDEEDEQEVEQKEEEVEEQVEDLLQQ